MSNQWALPDYVDGDWTIEDPGSVPVLQSPIPATTDSDVFEQVFVQALTDFNPTPLNTPHPSAGDTPDYSDFVLVKEGPKQDIHGGMVRWTRTYARVPESWDDYASYSYPLIGFLGVFLAGSVGVVNPVLATGRPRKARVVDCRIHRDYFLTGPGGSYTSPGDVPWFRAQEYFASDGTFSGITFIANGQTSDFISDPVLTFPATSPDRTTYVGWMANARSVGFDGDSITNWAGTWTGGTAYFVNDSVVYGGVVYTCTQNISGGGAPSGSGSWRALSTPSQFLAEDSKLSRWMGNIFVRETRYILAQ
jgi:hypothetical protein